MKKKTIISIVMVLAMILGIIQVPVEAGSSGKSGKWGETSWTLSKDGTLKITGSGAIDDWNSGKSSDAPSWIDYTMGDKEISVTSIVFGEGITSIGANTFVLSPDVTSIEFPSTLTEIKKGAFAYCESLESLVIPDTVKKIEENAFLEAHSLKSIYVDTSATSIDASAFVEQCEYESGKHEYKFEKYVSNTKSDVEKQPQNENSSEQEESSKKVEQSEAQAKSDKQPIKDPQIEEEQYEYSEEDAHEHKYETQVIPAGYYQRGIIITKCSLCGEVKSSTEIAAIKTIKLNKDTFNYTGKANKPSVIVIDEDGNTLRKSDYTVKYSNNKNIGVAKAVITFKGNYSGTYEVEYTITPKSVNISSLVSSSRGFKAKWKKVKGVTGYEIQYSLDKKFSSRKSKKVLVSKNSITNKQISKITGNKTYYVRIRTFKKVKSKKIYSKWSSAKIVKTKK